MDAEDGARLRAALRAESRNPFRKLRLWLYLAFAASGFIGFFVSFFRVLAGRDMPTSLINLGVQIAVIAVMVFLYRLEAKQQKKLADRYLERERREQNQ